MKKDELLKTIGAALRAKRLQLGWSLKDTAKRVGCSFQLLHKYEVGSTAMTLDAAITLSRVLAIPLSEFAGTRQSTGVMNAIPLAFAKEFLSLSDDHRAGVMSLVKTLARKM